MVKERELNCRKRRISIQTSPFSCKARAHIAQRFIPNKATSISQHNEHVFCGLFSQDGSMYMSACQDHNIRIYNTQNWKLKKNILARDVGWSIISVDYSPDKDWLIYSSWSDYVHICNTYGEHEVHEALDFRPESHRFCLFSIQFSPDSSEILGGSSDKCLYIYDIVKRKRISRTKGHLDDINAVCFADKSSQVFFSGSDDALVKIWDRRCLSSERCVGVLPGHHEGITFIDSKGDGNYLISNGKDQTIKLWDIRKMKNTTDVQPKSGSFDYRDTWGLSRSQRRELSPKKRSKDDCSVMTYTGHKVFQTLIRCRFSPCLTTGQKYIYSGSFDGTVYIYDVLTGELVSTLPGHEATVRDVHWHPFEPIIVSTSWDGGVKKWTYNENKKRKTKPEDPS